MASTTSGLSLLPVIGYALLAILLAYLGLRVYRYLKSEVRTPKSLPKPVSGSSQKSAFYLGRLTAWDWRQWTLPRVPGWSKVPNTVIGKAKSVANAKNLSVELLPTTGLPPPPTSIPTPMSVAMTTHQLVDLNTPPTPSLTTGSTFGSFQTSPRTPSPPFMHHISASKPLHPTPTNILYSRSPSPHALLATSPQKSHRRSRSLGGVSIRRLSGGSSGLRNAMEMQELSLDHVRGTSREHLLIDFSTSGSSEEDDTGGFMKISPAASDIGILPPGKEMPPRVDARTVGRHVPLVDLSEEDSEDGMTSSRAARNEDDDSWNWFGLPSNVPSLSFGRSAGLTETRPTSVVHTGDLVNVKDEPDPELVLGMDSMHVRRMELEVRHGEHAFVDIHDPKAHFELGANETTLVDLRGDYSDDEGPSVSRQLRVLDIKEQRRSVEPTKAPSILLPAQTPVLVKATFPHPLETLVHVDTIQFPIHQHTAMPVPDENGEASGHQPSLLFQHECMRDDHGPQNLQSNVSEECLETASESLTSGPGLVESAPLPTNPPVDLVDLENQTSAHGAWAWDEQGAADDPWANHISDLSSPASPASPDSEVFVYTGLDASIRKEQLGQEDLITFEGPLSPDALNVFVYDPESEVLEKSPGATLFATELADKEEGEMPTLDLDEVLPELEIRQVGAEISETISLDEEEDLTPKPTPASVELELPNLSLNIIDDFQVPVVALENSSQVDRELDLDDYADPELLPLPESPLLLTVEVPDPETPSLMFEKDDRLEKATPSQTPTPPASPPPISPLRFLGASNGLKSMSPSPRDDVEGMMMSLKLSPSPALTLVVGLSPKNSMITSFRDVEDKENATPTALNTTGSKPIWDTKSESIPLSSMLIPESPQLRRRIFADVAADTNREKLSDEEAKNETSMVSVVDLEPKGKIKDEASHHVHGLKPSPSLPGSFPEFVTTDSQSPATVSIPTIGARLALTSDILNPRPSARAIVRSPLDIALAMQLRPGLGAGADPAWMVRFLMAMFGWLAVVVSGQAEF